LLKVDYNEKSRSVSKGEEENATMTPKKNTAVSPYA
jgi:hypothetical protein